METDWLVLIVVAPMAFFLAKSKKFEEKNFRRFFRKVGGSYLVAFFLGIALSLPEGSVVVVLIAVPAIWVLYEYYKS